MSHMLETPEYPIATQGGEIASVGSISRKDLDVAWLAGIVDGEACISVNWWKQTNPRNRDNHGMRVALSIANVHPHLIKKVTQVLCDNEIRFTVPACLSRKPRGMKEKPCVSVVVMGKGRLLKLLPLITPHLTAKKRQAELALELIRYRESLAVHGRESKGRFANMDLRQDEKINEFIDMIKREKHEVQSVLDFSRHANTVFGESSTTLRSSDRESGSMIKSALHGDMQTSAEMTGACA